MKNSIITGFVFAATMVLAASCSDFLDEVKYTGTSYDYYESAEGFETAVVASYQNLRYCANSDNLAMIDDVGTDLFQRAGDGGSGLVGFDSYDNDINPSNSYLRNFWNNNYKGIAYVNTAFSKINDVNINDKTRIIRNAELHFLRAYYYFDLVLQFGDIPLVTESVSTPKTDYVRVAQKQIWSQIIGDLTESYNDLEWNDNSSEFGRATKGAAGHLLAKAYLYRSSVSQSEEDRGQASTDLDSCIYYSTKVIESGQYELLEDYSDVFDINNEGNKEIIFAVQYSSDYTLNNGTNANTGNNLHMMYTMFAEKFDGVKRDLDTGRPWRRFRPTEHGLDIYGKLNDSRMYKAFVWVYYCNDPDNAPKWSAAYAPDASLIGQAKFESGDTAIMVTYEKTGLSGDALADYTGGFAYHLIPFESYTNDYFPTLIKHLDNTRAAINTQGSGRDCIRMRLAETYLLAGEAYGRKGDWEMAAQYINPVRERAAWKDGETKSTHYLLFDHGDPNKYTESTVSDMHITASDLSSQSSFVDWIMDERGRELIGEINRRSDIKRNGATYFVDRVSKYNSNAAKNIQKYHRFFPIPQTHIDLCDPADPNPQNEGYN